MVHISFCLVLNIRNIQAIVIN